MVNKELLTYLVVDSVIMLAFITLNFSTNPNNRNIELTMLYWVAAFAVMITVSFLLNHLYFKKRKK
jgi:hypothetical protein